MLHDEEKEVGVALVDIGGGTTDIAVFEDRTIRHTEVVAVAGTKVTDDIRKGLGILQDQAERLKRQFGVALVDMIGEDQEISIPGIGERTAKSIGQSTLAQIIQPRLEEILEIVGIEIQRSGYSRHLSAGVVLTGGGSMIPGTAQLAAEILGLDARIGRPLRARRGARCRKYPTRNFPLLSGLVLYGLAGRRDRRVPVPRARRNAVQRRRRRPGGTHHQAHARLVRRALGALLALAQQPLLQEALPEKVDPRRCFAVYYL